LSTTLGNVNIQPSGSVNLYPTGNVNIEPLDHINLTPISGNVNLNGLLKVRDGIYSTNTLTNTLNITSPDVLFIGDSTGFQQTMRGTDTTKTLTVGLDTTQAFIGTTGTNMDLSIDATRYLQLQKPIYVEYLYSDITASNQHIGWTQNTANPNTGTTYTGTANDSVSPGQVGTFTLPSFGVWLIQFDCLLTLNTGSDTIINRGIFLSDTTGSATPSAPGFSMTDPIDDAAGGSGARQTYSFSGIYHYTSSTIANKYINVYAQTSGSRTVTASGSYKYTRIG
jgi:hypothetical protein